MKITSKGSRLALGAVAVAASAALALTGCTTSKSDSSSDKGSSNNKTITMALTNEATSFNNNTPQGNLDTNGVLGYLTTPSFYYLDNKYKVVHNSDVGSYKKTGDSPLTVQYNLKKGLKWSDGKPITGDDMYLAWAINSQYYESASTDEEGKVTKGNQYFATAAGKLYDTEMPKFSNDGYTMTVTYNEPYVDWELQSFLAQPLHSVAEIAGVSEKDAVDALKNTPKGDVNNPAPANDVLKKLGNVINTGYDATSLPSDKRLLVSGGPLKVTGWTPKQSMTLEKNTEYKGKEAVKFGKLVFRFYGDAAGQVTALRNGEVDIVQPGSPTADTLKSLKGLKGIETVQGNTVSYDHLDLNFKSAVFKDANVRKAFLLTIPRQQILDSIVKPINPKAKVLDSQIYLPADKDYAADVKQNGSSEFDKVDIEKAKQLLNGATPTVKILYNSGNPNRVASFQAIQASAKEAGINVVDGGSPKWSSLLPGGDYDASLFGWISSGAGNTMIPQLFQAGNSGNYNQYNNPTISDLAVKSQTTVDEGDLKDIKFAIDKGAFTDGYGLPLFQAPGIVAYSNHVHGIKYMGNQTYAPYNVWEWSKD